MLKSNIYLLKRLVNQAYPQAYANIVSHLEEVEFAVDDVQQSFDKVKAHSDEMIIMMNNVVEHPLTEKIADMRDTRHQYLLSLRGRVRYSLKSPIGDERVAAKTFYALLKGERKYISQKSIQNQSRLVNALVARISESSNLNEAVTKLGLQEVMNSVKAISNQLYHNYKQREVEKMAEAKKNNELRDTAQFALETFVTAVEQVLRLDKGDKADHLSYLKVVKTVASSYNVLHLNKTTRLKNAALEAEANQNANPENGEQTGDDVQPDGGKPATIAGRSKTFNVSTMNGMDLQNGGAPLNGGAQLDNKKDTLAMNGSVTNGDATTNDAIAKNGNDSKPESKN